MNEVYRAQSTDSSFRFSRDISGANKRCCICFSLQRGVTFIIIGDIAFLIAFIIVYSIQLANQLYYNELYNIESAYYGLYWVFTGGITTLLLLIKSFYGTKFLWYSSQAYKRQLDRNFGQRKFTITNAKNMKDPLLLI